MEAEARTGYIIGIDGGGSHSRAVCADCDGRILGLARGGGTSPSHNADAYENTQAILRDVLTAAGISDNQVFVLAAGLAGLDRPADLDWASRNTALPNPTGRRVLVNDSHVALAGALALRAGILSIAGTGTITTGLLPSGEYVSNYQFNHYSRSGAQYIGRYAVFELLNCVPEHADADLAAKITSHFELTNPDELHALTVDRLGRDRMTGNRSYANLAPTVTAAALSGSPIARRVCDRAAAEIVVAILLVAGCFPCGDVPVALTGGVLGSDYIQGAVSNQIACWPKRRLQVVPPALPPVGGAVLLALKELGLPITPTIVENLEGCRSLY
jgi:glucosamine kinase